MRLSIYLPVLFLLLWSCNNHQQEKEKTTNRVIKNIAFETIELSFYNGLHEIICLRLEQEGNFIMYHKKAGRPGLFYIGKTLHKTIDEVSVFSEKLVQDCPVERISCNRCGIFNLLVQEKDNACLVHGTLYGNEKTLSGMVMLLLDIYDGPKKQADTSFRFSTFRNLISEK